MKTIKRENITIKLHDSEKEVSEFRRSEFNKHIIQLFGKGDGMKGLFEHMQNIDAYNAAGDAKKVQAELINMRETMRCMWDKIDHRSMALACMVAEINGEPKNSFTEDALKEVINQMSESGITYEDITGWVEEIKKKLDAGLRLYFPEQFDNTIDLAGHYENIRQRALLVIKAAKGEDVESKIEALDKELLEDSEVRNFDPEDPDNFVIEYEQKREELYASMEQHGVSNPGSLTSFQFYTRLKLYKKKHTKNH